MKRRVRTSILVVMAILTIWLAAGFIRAKVIQSQLDHDLEKSGPDAFGGIKSEGHVTIEVELLPLLGNPFQSHPPAELKVNGVVRAVISS